MTTEMLGQCPTTNTNAEAVAGLQQAAQIFEEIASLASTLDRECYHANDVDELSDVETVQLHVDSLRRSIRQIGLLADMGAERTSGTQVKGGAEAWLMPPTFLTSASLA